MTLSRIARVGGAALFTILLAGIIFVGNQRLAEALNVPMPDVSDPNVPTSEVASDVPSGSDINSNLDTPSGSDIVCKVFDYLNDVGSGLSVPFPVFADGCGDRGALEVKKIVSGGTASSADFQINVQGEGNSFSNAGSASGRTYANLEPGSYSVSESGGPSGYTAAFSGDCNSSGSVAVSAGVKASCTVTNTFVGDEGGGGNNSGDKPKLTVTKVVVNDGGGTAVASDFSLSATLTEEGISESVGLASGVQAELTMAGTWKVSEQQKEGYVGTFSGDCDAEGKVTLADGDSKNCTLTNTYTPSNQESGGSAPPTTSGGGGGPPTSGGGTPTTTSAVGQVLGAAASSITACDQYLTAFIRTGKANDEEQVKRLQAVLIEFEKAPGVQITGAYDEATLAAVHAFQAKYASEILTPWGVKESTGYVYLTTRKKVNEVYCQGTKVFPLTSAEQRIVDRARAGTSTPAITQVTEAETGSAEKETPEGNGQEAAAGASTPQTGSFWERLMNLFKGVRSPNIR